MKTKTTFALAILIALFNVNNVSSQKEGTFTDPRDGKTYKTVEIGDQIWMAQNLAFKTDGGCWAYEGKEENVDKYGYFYSAEVSKAVAPEGWHLPTKDEFNELLNSYKSKKRYKELMTGGGSGFNGELTGICLVESGNFTMFGKMAGFWSSSTISNFVYSLVLKGKNDENNIAVGANPNNIATNIRLVKDK